MQKAGGFSALYLAAAYLAAMPYFLIVVDLGSITDPFQKAAALLAHRNGLYLMELVVYVLFGLALIVLSVALKERLSPGAEGLMKVATPIGLIWAGLLIASGMIHNVGMDPVIALHATDPSGAASLWAAVDLVSSGLSGNGEILGGSWLLLVSLAALRTRGLPKALNLLGLAVAAIGIVSVVPPIKDLAMIFGLGQIVWALWLGIALLGRPRAKAAATSTAAPGPGAMKGGGA